MLATIHQTSANRKKYCTTENKTFIIFTKKFGLEVNNECFLGCHTDSLPFYFIYLYIYIIHISLDISRIMELCFKYVCCKYKPNTRCHSQYKQIAGSSFEKLYPQPHNCKTEDLYQGINSCY